MSANAKNHSAVLLPASLGALGVVYGDIGTSPLYALREATKAAAAGQLPTSAAVIAATSAIVWAIIVVVALKYALLILRADNRGEGGRSSENRRFPGAKGDARAVRRGFDTWTLL